MATVEQELDSRINSLCKALEYFEKAIVESPHKASYHIALADMESQIRNSTQLCNRNIRKGHALNPKERLRLATLLAPNNVETNYFASVVHLASGDKATALALLRRNQETNPLFTEAQRNYTYRLVTTEEELAIALPNKFPEVAKWLHFFFNERPADYQAWHATFELALSGAVGELKERYGRGQIAYYDFSNFIKRISELPLSASSETVRRELDRVLAHIYDADGLNDWAQVLRERQKLARLPILKSLMKDDKSPRTSMLFGWVSDHEARTASLDYLGRVVGIYLPAEYALDMLILQSSRTANLKPGNLELLASNDNLHFHVISNDIRADTIFLDGKEAIVFRFDEGHQFRFMKIRYKGAERQPNFVSTMQQLVQAYGRERA
jgi:hypothetical protein